MSLPETRIPYLPKGVRLHDDKVRKRPVLLGPERALMMDQIGHIILQAVDGEASIATISEDLAQRFEAPVAEIMADVSEFLDGMAEKQMIWYRQ